jgi:hypothetical protein
MKNENTPRAAVPAHTPGPWRIVDGDPAMIAAGNRLIAQASEIEGSDANAQLIAAAPDMLAALRKADAFFSRALTHWEHSEVGSIVRAAITKADNVPF